MIFLTTVTTLFIALFSFIINYLYMCTEYLQVYLQQISLSFSYFHLSRFCFKSCWSLIFSQNNNTPQKRLIFPLKPYNLIIFGGVPFQLQKMYLNSPQSP